jgi:hypothetical protein
MKTIQIGSPVRFKKNRTDIRVDRIITDETYIYRGKTGNFITLEDPRGHLLTSLAYVSDFLGGYGRFE